MTTSDFDGLVLLSGPSSYGALLLFVTSYGRTVELTTEADHYQRARRYAGGSVSDFGTAADDLKRHQPAVRI